MNAREEQLRAAYLADWQRKLASKTRRRWRHELETMDLIGLHAWQREIIAKLRRGLKETRPMERWRMGELAK